MASFSLNPQSWNNSTGISNSCQWKVCAVCRKTAAFKSPKEFCFHLRNFHCSKEGGSYVCRYGVNDVCPSLPLEGVSDKDYEDHVARDHVYTGTGYGRSSGSQISHKGISGDVTPPFAAGYKEPSIVQDQFKWTIYNASVNLPAVLNDPRLAKRETDFFTKTWGEGFEKKDVLPSANLPEINRSHFEKYLSRISEKYKTHTHSIEQIAKQQFTDRLHSRPLKCIKQMEKNRADLDQVPKIFMLPNFSLENPDTFSAVFPWTQVEESKPDKCGNRQSCKLLQEKLSHYLDTVEVQIGEQISMRSEAFFHAMTSHDELQDYMQVTCRAIKQLRDKIHALEETLAKGSLKILKLYRSRTNYAKLHNKLKLISTVHQTQPTIQLLLSTNEFVGALDLISTTQEVLAQELAGIHSFRHLGSQLAELEKIIDMMLHADLVKYVTAELNRPITDLQALADEEKLIAIVLGMLRQHNFEFVNVLREEAFTALKATIKQSVIEAVATADDIDTEGNVGSLADQMRLLNYTQWMQMLKNVFHNILIIINRVIAFHTVIRGVILIAAGRTGKDAEKALLLPEECCGNKDDDENEVPTVVEPEDEELLHLSVSEDLDVMISEAEFLGTIQCLKKMLCSVCDHAHDRCVKLMVARAKDGFLEKLSSSEFVALSRVIEGFVTECERKCGRRSTSLRGSLLNQANRFVDRFHEERKTKLSLILDNERWKQADVPTEFQEMVDHISKLGRMQLPEKRIDLGKKPAEFIVVNEEKFAVVGTVLMLLKMMVEYCECVDDIPAAAQDILTRLIDLLKTFNSRTCQLVLGAGALQLVGLKTISTKNLALASRCLQLIVHYIPYVKDHFKPKLYNKKHMLKHLDQITKDYLDHIEEISNKLVAIMEGLTESYVIKWDAKAPMPSSCFRSVCKQMTKFHEVIIDVLPQHQVKVIFQRIHKSFVNFLRQQLLTLNVTNDGGPQNGLVNADIVFYENNMKALKGVEDVIEGMQTVWTTNYDR